MLLPGARGFHLKGFSGTCVYFVAISSESSAQKLKVDHENCILHQILVGTRIARGQAHVGGNVGKIVQHSFQKAVAFKLGVSWLIDYACMNYTLTQPAQSRMLKK